MRWVGQSRSNCTVTVTLLVRVNHGKSLAAAVSLDTARSSP